MTTTDLSPIGLQAIPDGHKPCAACGIPTTGKTTKYLILTRVIAMGTGERYEEMADGAGIDLAECSDCQAISEAAEAIVESHPGLVRHLGTVALWRTTTALYALDSIGHRLPSPDITPERLGSLVHRLAAPGALVAYSRRFSPVMEADASPKLSARERWSAVEPEALAECRRGAVDWMADGRPLRALPHPGRRRCDWCGTATAPGRRVSEAWFGDLCANCHAVEVSGGRSYEAFWRAIDPDLAIRRRRPIVPDIDGVRPYSQAPAGDGEPWSHLGGIVALHEHVKRLVDAS